MASDSHRKRIVSFGGRTFGGRPTPAATWEWDGKNWLRKYPATSPSARFGHAMAYDSKRRVTVMFGGVGLNSTGGLTMLGDTWEWDAQNWVQRKSSVSPAPRAFHAMAFDPVRDEIVQFGGADFVGHQDNGLWHWNGTVWRRTASANQPRGRSDHAMVYDTGRQRLVVVGGVDFSAPWKPLNETWEWDGNGWSQRASDGASTLQRLGAAYDEAAQVVLTLGGFSYSEGNFGSDTWTWDGSRWVLQPGTRSPGYRAGQPMVYDTKRSEIVLFGDRAAWFGDTWTWDGQNWREIQSAASPQPRDFHAMAYDVTRARTLLFGGFSYNSGKHLRDTWEFDGTSWTRKILTRAPLARQGHSMAWHPARGAVILSGGAVPNAIMGDMWEWNGTRWTPIPGLFTQRYHHAMVYDEARQELVMFGGRGATGVLQDTWVWDGRIWSQKTPVTSPPSRSLHSMVYDPNRQRVILYGGSTGAAALADVWEWDGQNWAQRQVNSGPGMRARPVMIYDSARRRTLVYGGRSDAATQAWEYGPVDAAHYQRFGAACGGTSASPRLDAAPFSLPWIGDTFSQRVSGVSTSSVVGMIIGNSDSWWNGASLPASLKLLGMPGCSLYVSYDIFIPLVNQSGTASLALPIPIDRALLGQTFFNQAIATAPGANPAGIVTTEAAAVTIGSR